MCDKASEPSDHKVRYDEVNQGQDTAKSSVISTANLRQRLAREANMLSDRLSQINYCLNNLTPEMEQSMQVWETLRRLGIR